MAKKPQFHTPVLRKIGVWALDYLPSDYHALISAALDAYRHNTPHTFDPIILNTFADYIFNLIQPDL